MRQAHRRATAVRLKVQNSQAPSDRQWKLVLKNPDAHKGEFYVVTAQITQFDAATGDDTFLADSASHNTMSYGYFEGENTMFTGAPRSSTPSWKMTSLSQPCGLTARCPTTPRSVATRPFRC